MTELTKPYEYFAFISYKREDEKWAKWLQHKLEYYKLPSSIRKDNPDLPDKIRPVFKDTTDLEPGVLAQKIQDALNSSKFLIVICSPRSANSVWVSKEVKSFIDSGRADHIIPFIIGGTPNAADPKDECFPEGLRQLAGEQELLGANINEMGREAAAIKVIARMFNLRFDTLWQRYERWKRRKTTYIICVIALALLGTLSVLALLWGKNNQIADQNNQLNVLVKNLQEENITVSKQRERQERYTYMGSLRGRDEVFEFWNFSFHPFEPIVAFSDDWGFWLHNIKNNTEVELPTNSAEAVLDVSDIKFSKDGEHLIGSSWGGIFIWDVNSTKLIKHYPPFIENIPLPELSEEKEEDYRISLEDLNIKSNQDYFWDGKKIFSGAEEALINDDKLVESSSGMEIIYNEHYKEILFIGDYRCAIYDEKIKKFIQYFKGYGTSTIFLSPTGDYLLIDRDIFERNSQIDTITDLPYKKLPTKNWNEKCQSIDKNSNVRNLRTNDNFIEYQLHGENKFIEVIKPSNSGNGQEYLSDAVYIEPNKIAAIVCQGRHKIFNAVTGMLLGTLQSYVWDGEDVFGHEDVLSHAESFIASSKVIDRYLYVMSSGGVIRIYSIDRLRLEKVLGLPLEIEMGNRIGAIEECFFSDDGTKVYYHFYDDPWYYECDISSTKNELIGIF